MANQRLQTGGTASYTAAITSVTFFTVPASQVLRVDFFSIVVSGSTFPTAGDPLQIQFDGNVLLNAATSNTQGIYISFHRPIVCASTIKGVMTVGTVISFLWTLAGDIV